MKKVNCRDCQHYEPKRKCGNFITRPSNCIHGERKQPANRRPIPQSGAVDAGNGGEAK